MTLGRAATGYVNPRCYLRATFDCDSKLTAEHPVSEAILKTFDGIRVHGMAWQAPGEVKLLPIPALTAKILCKRHNEMLSDVDSAFLAFYTAMRQAIEPPHAPLTIDSFDGDAIERWSLKLLYGSLYGNWTPTRHSRGSTPPSEWVDVLLGRASFPADCGMFVGQPAPVTTPGRYVQVSPLRAVSDGSIVGAEIVVGVLPWLLSMVPIDEIDGFPRLLDETHTRAGGHVDDMAVRILRPGEIAFRTPSGARRLRLRWTRPAGRAVSGSLVVNKPPGG